MVPLYAAVDYYLLEEDEPMRPYVGLGIGTLYSHRFLDMGLYEVTDESWHFALRPEAGVLVEANSGLSIMLTGRWNYAFETSDVVAQQFFTINIGAAFLIW
jgi:outer membrane protein